VQGPYDQPTGFDSLHARMTEVEAARPRANRMFFLSIPPNVFVAAAAGAADRCSSPTGELRAEGRQRASAMDCGFSDCRG
jgi:glucose-6-phosphate 1-dehydrogenase